jgi:CubicO group peptidase (beta-lactamase class C family)
MMTQELERTNPSDVGLSAGAIGRYVESLQACGTEMHGLMIARHGKVCAAGWWRPYAPGMIHGLQSLSKSYVATAIGLLLTAGQLTLNEKLIDIFPECEALIRADNLRRVTLHDLLCMGAGNNSMQDRTKSDWLNDFFASEFPFAPGQHFYYSGLVTSVLGAVVRRKTGLGLMEFLRPALFDKIGIDAGRLKWIEHPDGLEYGGGGLIATTEDNLRLGLLYLNGGLWQGERLLAADFVQAASHKQIETTGEGPADNSIGYGYQMWMCQPAGVFRFDGAHGQFVIVVPDLDLVIAINQTAEGRLPQTTLDITWAFLAEVQHADSVASTGAAGSTEDAALVALLARLALPRPPYNGLWRHYGFPAARLYRFPANDMDLMPGAYRMLSHKAPRGFEQMTFHESDGEIVAGIRCQGSDYLVHISLDGIDRLSILPIAPDLPDRVFASGIWRDAATLAITLKYIETCYSVQMAIRQDGDAIEVTAERWNPAAGSGPETVRIRSL